MGIEARGSPRANKRKDHAHARAWELTTIMHAGTDLDHVNHLHNGKVKIGWWKDKKYWRKGKKVKQEGKNHHWWGGKEKKSAPGKSKN